jgi:hypothetical protein
MHKDLMNIKIHNGVKASGRYESDLARNPKMFR